MDSESKPLLEVRGLSIQLAGKQVLRDFSCKLYPGEIVGVVGESGSGKTQLLLALLGLTPAEGQVSGEVLFEGETITPGANTKPALCGNRMSMLFQDPSTALNPYLKIGLQMSESVCLHQGLAAAQAQERAHELLGWVGLSDTSSLLQRYPHELSGGMRQRVALAMALMTSPQVLLADEPTTALDVTTQAQVLDRLLALRQASRLAILLVTHDLGVVARVADRILVLQQGELLEQGDCAAVLDSPQHAYTQQLVRSALQLEGAA